MDIPDSIEVSINEWVLVEYMKKLYVGIIIEKKWDHIQSKLYNIRNGKRVFLDFLLDTIIGIVQCLNLS